MKRCWRNISEKRVFEVFEARTSHISIACEGLTTTANYATSACENSKIEMLALRERERKKVGSLLIVLGSVVEPQAPAES